jgi:hypothetical protein
LTITKKAFLEMVKKRDFVMCRKAACTWAETRVFGDKTGKNKNRVNPLRKFRVQSFRLRWELWRDKQGSKLETFEGQRLAER